jgi:hypothetical protein
MGNSPDDILVTVAEEAINEYDESAPFVESGTVVGPSSVNSSGVN